MRSTRIEIGKVYRIKNNPYYFKAIEILRAKQKENKTNRILVKGHLSTNNDFSSYLTKYIKPSDLQ